ncbi:hypothetical protein J3B02_004935, partial [Coemansia erecta]
QQPQHQHQHQHQQQLHSNSNNAWLASALSQQSGLDISGSIHNFALPSSLAAPAGAAGSGMPQQSVVPDGLGYLQGISPEDLRLIMSQQVDLSGGGGMGFGHPTMQFTGDVQPSLSMAQDYSAADIQGLMRRLTTFNSSSAEDSSSTPRQ